MGTGVRGSGSRGLVEGTYVRGGASGAARGAGAAGSGVDIRDCWGWTSECHGVTRGLVRSRAGMQTGQAGLAYGRRVARTGSFLLALGTCFAPAPV